MQKMTSSFSEENECGIQRLLDAKEALSPDGLDVYEVLNVIHPIPFKLRSQISLRTLKGGG